jgi:hypothetical protein
VAEQFRDRLQADLEARYSKLLKVIDDGLEAQKEFSATCEHCNRRTRVQVNDVRGAILAAEFIANQSHGRPGVAAGDSDGEKIIFIRCVDENDAHRIYEAALKVIPKERFEEFASLAAYRPTAGQSR